MDLSVTSTLKKLSVTLNLDPAFIASCLAVKQSRDYFPISSPTDTLTSPTAPSFPKFPKEEVSRLKDDYPFAYSDFYGHSTPCIYKTGDPWPIRTGPDALQGTERDPRPIYRHPIASQWLDVLFRITEALDNLKLQLTSIDPLAYAHPDEAKPFCPFVISVGVEPHSLVHSAAVVAGEAVQSILDDVGHPTIQVAFVESKYRRSCAGSKRLPFSPLTDRLPRLRKPFTSTLGLPIAPLKYPNYEGTGALYFRLNSNDNRVAMLTCAHVAHPPPVHRNRTTTLKQGTGQPREEFIALGAGAFANALKSIMGFIGEQIDSIEVWNEQLVRLGKEMEAEPESTTEARVEYKDLIKKAATKLTHANELHNEITKRHTLAEQRVFGRVLHCEEIDVAVEPKGYTKDWAFIEVYPDAIDWDTFKGNKIWIGDLLPSDFLNTLYPEPSDRADYSYPKDGLLQVKGFVPESEFRDPQNVDVHGLKSLLCAKNGRSTNTTFGRVNGLESLVRNYDNYGIHRNSIEVTILGYDPKTHKYHKFSEAGDSGAIVAGRDGRIIGIITGGAGPTDETDKTYITPYHWLGPLIKAKFPDSFLYNFVE